MESPKTTPSVAPAPRTRPLGGIVVGIVVLALGAGYLFGGNGEDSGGGRERETSLSGAVTPSSSPSAARGGGEAHVTVDDPSWGPKGALVTVVEFSDFQCPFCREAYPTVRRLVERYGDRVLFQYRDFPIADAHADAQKAAEAAECAHDQGKFWEYHDRLFQNQEDLGREALTRYALAVNLDIASFNRCLDGGAKVQEVLEDFQEGVAAGIGGTPTFFVNGVKHEGVLSEDEFSAIFDSLLGK